MRLIEADALKELFPDNGEGSWTYNETAKTYIDAQPTIEARRWIPCSERLPEDDTLMLVNYIDNRPDAMDIWIGWYEMENVWYIDGEPHRREFGNEVIAWMPLPESYSGETESRDYENKGDDD